MNVLRSDKKLAVLSALVEGNSIRGTSRMTGVNQRTILKLLGEMGEKSARLLDEKIRGVSCQVIEGDEVWTFVKKKERKLTPEEKLRGELGDQYTWVAFDPESKLVLAFLVGKRNAANACRLMQDLRERVVGHPQITTDALRAYLEAVELAFGADCDYAQLTKTYAAENPGPGRYAPPKISGVEITEISGRPERGRVCTSYVERNNLTMRMMLKRLTRLTLAFSKKLVNLKAAVALHFFHYNFCRIHGSLRVTPAMAAGLTDRVWELSELLAA